MKGNEDSLAEQFKRTYISAAEFIDSWEKEVYQLTNLDYFSFLLINDLALAIEQDFFSRIKNADVLQLGGDEIITLAFSITDSLQDFLEKNCFGTCSLRCPCKLDAEINIDESVYLDDLNRTCKIYTDSTQTREQCLSSDILNYVILDSMLDFYNYEMGIILSEGDRYLLDFAEFILNKVIAFIRNKGQRFLCAHNENATDLFNEYLQSSESLWQDRYNFEDHDDEDEDEQESWKAAYSDVEMILDELLAQYQSSNTAFPSYRIVEYFKEYLCEYLELSSIDELNMEDLREFFTVVLPHEMLLDEHFNFDALIDLFTNILTYLEFNHGLYLNIPYDKFIENEMPEIIRTFKITQSYNSRYPFLDHLLSPDNTDETLIEGFFEVEGKGNQHCRLKDIHLKTRYQPVDFSSLAGFKLKSGDILHLKIIKKNDGWKISRLEMVYPALARYFLY